VAVRETRVQKTVFEKILKDKLAATRQEIQAFARPANESLAMIQQWGENGLLDPENPAFLTQLLVPCLDPHPQVAACYLLWGQDQAYTLHRNGDRWTRAAPRENDTLRARPWFREFAARNDTSRFFWSQFHAQAAGPDSVLTAVTTWQDSRIPSQAVVAACDLYMSQLDTFASQAPLTENGLIIIRRAQGSLAWAAPQRGRGFSLLGDGIFQANAGAEVGLVAGAVSEWINAGNSLNQPFTFAHHGHRWWGVFHPLAADVPGSPLVGLVAPAADLEARLQKVTDTFTYALFGLLAMGTVMLIGLAVTYREKLRRLTRRARLRLVSEADLVKLIAAGESDRLEFKSTLRWNLNTNKPGKEVEISWLKTVVAYLNSEGGVLLIGVGDEGTVLGIANDQFPNEDKFLLHFNNLIKEHLGLEMAPFLRAKLMAVAGKKVLVVQCEKAKVPAFLKKGNQEEFYIRVGPSSRQLGTSQILEYLKQS
jgi:hypothetical protein